MSLRVIPRLDIKGPNLVKGVQFEGLRVLGKPEDFARHYYEQGADELIYMDAVASLYGRNSLEDIVRRTSKELFVPLCVGGGLRSIDDIRSCLRSGADKVALNSAAVAEPELIRRAAHAFGSSTIVVSIEAHRKPDGSYEALTDFGRQSSGVDAIKWAQRAVELGAGELLVTSVDRDGTGKGYDIDLIRSIATVASVPVIAAGGAGSIEHLSNVVRDGAADAVSLASMLHYRFVRSAALDRAAFSSEGNIEFLASAGTPSRLRDASIPEIKQHLEEMGIECRPVRVQ